MMAAHADTTTTARPARRADAGTVRLSQRDIDGLLLAGEHYGGAPYDLLATALQVDPARLPAIVARWRRAGYAATGRPGPGPGWCWLTRTSPASARRAGRAVVVVSACAAIMAPLFHPSSH